jgi:hypothetical protein
VRLPVETWVNEAARRGGRVLSSGLLGCGSAFGRSGAFDRRTLEWLSAPLFSAPLRAGCVDPHIERTRRAWNLVRSQGNKTFSTC